MQIELEIYFFTPEIMTEYDATGKYELRKCPTKKMTFYNVNGIGPYEEGRSSVVLCNGSEYVCKLTYGQLKKKMMAVYSQNIFSVN